MCSTRWLVCFFLLVVCVCSVSADVIELRVNELPNFGAQDVQSRADCAVIRRFMELHPNIRLKRATGLSIEGGTNAMDMVPLMQIAGDIAPDVLYVNFRMSDAYIKSGFLMPLDKYIAEMSQEDLNRRIAPAIRDVVYRKGPDNQKHCYMLPTARLVRVLVYRRDLFMRAGLDPDSPPKTWSEFERYAKKICQSQKGRYGAVFSKGDNSAWDFVNLVWSRGGEVVAQDSKGNWRPMFNTPEMVDALHYYVRMNKIRWKTPSGDIQRGYAYRDTQPYIMTPGDLYAMSFSYLGDKLNVFDPGILGFAPVPHPDGFSHGASEINCTMLGVFSGIKDPKRARAAFDYVAFLDSEEANRIRVKTYVQNGYGKLVNPDLLERLGYTDYLKQVDRNWVRVYNDALVNGKPEPYGENCSVVYRELSKPIEQALNDSVVIAAIDRGDEKAAKRRIAQILNTAQKETAESMYGTLPPDVAARRYKLTWGFLLLALLVFSVAVYYLVRMFRQSAPSQAPGQKKTLYAYMLLLPAVASVLLWQYYPLLRGTLMAFQNYNLVGSSPFVGVANFSDVLFDPGFWHSVYVTIAYTALYMAFAFITPIILALLLSEIPRGKIFFRTVFYLPAVLSGLVVMFLWKSFYTPTGLLNSVLSFLGIHLTGSWLDTPSLAMAAVLLPVVWAGMGPGSLIYLAALKTIPDEFYEAADIDGANVVRKVWNITIPSMKMLIMINAVGAFIGAFMSSETIFAMTGGGPYTPYGTTEVVGLRLFYTAFVYLKFGAANAMAWVLGFMLIGFTMMQLKNLSRVEFKGGK